MNFTEPTLCMVLADSCSHCTRFKQTLPEVEKKLKTEGIKYQIFHLKSTGDNPANYNVPPALARCLKWFPCFAVVVGDMVIDVFNGEKAGDCWSHKSSGGKQPHPDNLTQFHREAVRNYAAVRTTQTVTTTGDLKMTAPPATPVASTSGFMGTASSMMNRPTGFIPTSACKIGGFRGRVI